MGIKPRQPAYPGKVAERCGLSGNKRDLTFDAPLIIYEECFMPINRRQFLVGVGSTLISPRIFDLFSNHIEIMGEPILNTPANPDIKLVAGDGGSDGRDYLLHRDYIEYEMPDFSQLSVREYYEIYVKQKGTTFDCFAIPNYIGAEDDLVEGYEDEIVCPVTAENYWLRNYSSNSRAFDVVKGLDLNLDKQITREQGIIYFTEYGGVLGDYTGVESDLLGLSFLQEKINLAGKNIAVTMA